MPLDPLSIAGISTVAPAALGAAGRATEAVAGFAEVLGRTLGLDGQQPSAESPQPAAPEPAHLDQLKQHAEQLLRQFRERLDTELRAQGLELPADAKFTLRPGGRVEVSGQGAQQIEALLSQRHDLSDLLRQATASLELLAAADRHLDFRNAYEEDPVTAATQFRTLLDEQAEEGLRFHLDGYPVL